MGHPAVPDMALCLVFVFRVFLGVGGVGFFHLRDGMYICNWGRKN